MKPVRVVSVAALVVAVLAVVAVVAARRSDQPGAGEAEVAVHGRARVERASGGGGGLSSTGLLRSGDTFTLLSGSADLQAPGGVTYHLRARSGRRSPRLVMGAAPGLSAGDLLVTTTGGRNEPVVVTAGSSRVEIGPSPGGAAARLSQSYALTVAVYRGSALVDSAGSSTPVSAYRSVEVPAPGRIDRVARPMQIDPADPWDRLLLGPAIAIDDQLVPVLSGWARIGGGGWTPQQIHDALPGQPPAADLVRDISPTRDGVETMVGAAISGLGTRGTYGRRWEEVFAFRDAGASWGLVAMDQGVGAPELLAAVSQPINGTPLSYPAPAPVTTAPNGAEAVSPPG